jgi:hypothetical protein
LGTAVGIEPRRVVLTRKIGVAENAVNFPTQLERAFLASDRDVFEQQLLKTRLGCQQEQSPDVSVSAREMNSA